jgi:hypothetical protein
MKMNERDRLERLVAQALRLVLSARTSRCRWNRTVRHFRLVERLDRLEFFSSLAA